MQSLESFLVLSSKDLQSQVNSSLVRAKFKRNRRPRQIITANTRYHIFRRKVSKCTSKWIKKNHKFTYLMYFTLNVNLLGDLRKLIAWWWSEEFRWSNTKVWLRIVVKLLTSSSKSEKKKNLGEIINGKIIKDSLTWIFFIIHITLNSLNWNQNDDF